eukprot:1046082-Amphidinium_carterae.1
MTSAETSSVQGAFRTLLKTDCCSASSQHHSIPTAQVSFTPRGTWASKQRVLRDKLNRRQN